MTINEKLTKYVSFFKNAKTVCLLCHMNPDSDTLGSALALRLALLKLNYEVYIFCDDNVPSKLSFMPSSECVNKPTDIKKFDICSAVDCSDSQRFNICGKYFKHAKTTLAIDHHKTTNFKADYVVSDMYAAATAELIFKVIKILEKEYDKQLFDKDIATLLFCSMVGDTGGFAFENVTEETFKIAGELVKLGVNNREIIYKMIKSQPVCRYKLKGRAMNHTRFFEDGQIGILTYMLKDFEECDCATTYTDGIINELVDVDSVKVAFAISEVSKNQFKVSIRTKAPYDATYISQIFGGGGHDRAAGCRISGFYEDVIDKIVKSAKDMLDA